MQVSRKTKAVFGGLAKGKSRVPGDDSSQRSLGKRLVSKFLNDGDATKYCVFNTVDMTCTGAVFVCTTWDDNRKMLLHSRLHSRCSLLNILPRLLQDAELLCCRAR